MVHKNLFEGVLGIASFCDRELEMEQRLNQIEDNRLQSYFQQWVYKYEERRATASLKENRELQIKSKVLRILNEYKLGRFE